MLSLITRVLFLAVPLTANNSDSKELLTNNYFSLSRSRYVPTNVMMWSRAAALVRRSEICQVWLPINVFFCK